MSAETPPAARLVGVGHRHAATIALDGIDLDIPVGRTLGLIGPDGVGKSTLLGLIAGVRHVQTGTVEVLGGDIAGTAHRQAVCARIAYMPQGLGRNLYPALTVTENIDFFGRLFGRSAEERHERTWQLLVATGLDPFPDRPAGKLSGGMKQKLGLCCALILDPDLLILDEPTSGVDPIARDRFWAQPVALSREAVVTIFVSTHFMTEAVRCDRISLMHAGRVLAIGPLDELRAQRGAATLDDAFVD